MNKVALSILGYDRPGIIAAVSRVLLDYKCNIEDVSQTILQTEFAGVFIASIPDELGENVLLRSLEEKLHPLGLSVLLKRVGKSGEDWTPSASQPFVITTLGHDRMGLVAGVTELLAKYRVNISNLRAVFRGGSDVRQNLMIYEVDIPEEIDQNAFRNALQERAGELGLDLSIQHRDIFQAIHRV
jgi:glycine cleavage system transcriptional repressor